LTTKHLLLIIILTAMLSGQTLEVKSTRQLLKETDSPFAFPSYTVDGQALLVTQTAYTGLWRLDRESEDLVQLTAAVGAGYEPRSLADGSIIYRQDEYEKGRKLTSLFKVQGDEHQRLTEPARFVSPANMMGDHLIYLQDESFTVLDGTNGELQVLSGHYATVLNDKLTLKVYDQDGIRPIMPQGSGNYIWSAMSPDGQRVVYTKTGTGTFVCDLNGKVLADLGYAHAAQWSPDGSYIAYMKDYDDGVQYTSSEIWVATADGQITWQITDTPERIEMYPQWSPDGSRLVYQSLQGEIFETIIEIAE